MTNIADALTRARLAAGLTQVQIARKLGLTQARLSQIEHGQNARVDTLQSYARALGLELLLVPAQQVRQVRSMLSRGERSFVDQDHPSRFPSLAELSSPVDDERPERSRRAKEPPP